MSEDEQLKFHQVPGRLDAETGSRPKKPLRTESKHAGHHKAVGAKLQCLLELWNYEQRQRIEGTSRLDTGTIVRDRIATCGDHSKRTLQRID